MIYQVLMATLKDPKRNDFVVTCKKYLKKLKIDLEFEEIENMSKSKFKKLLKEKTNKEAFLYLKEQKENQKKIQNIEYKSFKMQDYFKERKSEVSKTIFAARGKNLDIKMQKPWKYQDKLCVGCKLREETGDELLQCEGFGEKETFPYEFFFSQSVENQRIIGENVLKRLRQRKKMMDV